ncbi:hypothetical protein MRY87_05530 [bacterium]|nr:hypothetical protein [bacterium]
MKRSFGLAAVIVAILSGCTPVSGGTGAGGGNIGRASLRSPVQYLDRQQVVREEVANHPTAFSAAGDQWPSLWKRSQLLSSEYLNVDTNPKVIRGPSEGGFHIRHFPKQNSLKQGSPKQNSSQQGELRHAPPYAYEILAVRRDAQNDGLLSVQVNVVNLQSGKQDRDARLLARNIARFLKTGVFERDIPFSHSKPL